MQAQWQFEHIVVIFSNSSVAISSLIHNFGPGNQGCYLPRGSHHYGEDASHRYPTILFTRIAAMGFNRSRWTNLCRGSPVCPDFRRLFPATLLAEVTRRERLLMFTVSPGSLRSYHRSHRNDCLIIRSCRPWGLRSRVHLVISGQSKLWPTLWR